MRPEDFKDIVDNGDPYSTILNNIIKDKGGNEKQYRRLLDLFAYHESAGTMNPKIHQFGGGPGRGKYQFEGKDGSNRILTSAVRTKNYFRSKGLEVPQYIQDIIKKGTWDASTLSAEQQDILVLGDLRMKEGVDLSKYISGEAKVEDIWADHWWAGGKKLRDKRIKSFKKSQEKYSKLHPDQNIIQQRAENFQAPSERAQAVQKIDNLQVAQQNIKPVHTATQPNPEAFKSDFSSYVSGIVNNIKDKNVNNFDAGGSHETNPYGGIPYGQGKTVQQGESSFNFQDGTFVFSDNISMGGQVIHMDDKNNDNMNYKYGGKKC